MTAPLASLLDAIPLVRSVADRAARFPSPLIGQRVQRLDARQFERWTGTAWLVDTTVQAEDLYLHGAVGDGAHDDTAAWDEAQAAALVNGRPLRVPTGSFKLTATRVYDSGSRINIIGDGLGTSKLINGVTGGDPLFRLSALSPYFLIQGLEVVGNGLTGSAGNGHAFAVINDDPGAGVTTFSPQHVVFRDVTISGHLGDAKDETAAAMPASGIFSFACTVQWYDDVTVYQCGAGIRLKQCSKVSVWAATIDSCATNAIYFDTVEQVSVEGTTLNGSGNAGATDGLIFAKNCESVRFAGCRLKNGNPYLLNFDGITFINQGITIEDCDCRQLDVLSGHTIAKVGSGTINFRFLRNTVEWVNAITDAVGLDVVQGAGGYDLVGFEAMGNHFAIGAGGTITAAIRLNVGTNKALAPRIVGNTFGDLAALASATTITAALLVTGNCEDPLLEGNTFLAGTNLTIAAALSIAASTVHGVRIRYPQYAGAGTITAKIANSGGGTFHLERLDGISADRGDANQTLVAGVDWPTQRWATNLSANRAVTLSTTGAVRGDRFRVVRTGVGSFTLDVGGLKTIPSDTAAFVDVAYDGSAWVLTGYGPL